MSPSLEKGGKRLVKLEEEKGKKSTTTFMTSTAKKDSIKNKTVGKEVKKHKGKILDKHEETLVELQPKTINNNTATTATRAPQPNFLHTEKVTQRQKKSIDKTLERREKELDESFYMVYLLEVSMVTKFYLGNFLVGYDHAIFLIYFVVVWNHIILFGGIHAHTILLGVFTGGMWK